MNWQYLTSEDTFIQLIKDSHSDEFPGVLLFKHSTRCPVSSMALKRAEAFLSSTSLPCYLVNVIEARQLSNKAQEVFGVIHQSPQVLIIKNGHCAAHTSHEGIEEAWLRQYIENALPA